MKSIGPFRFPENPEEAKGWAPAQFRVALHMKVLVIARTRIEGTWAAYCFPVPGQNHDAEERLWERHGAKLHEPIARAMFPRFSEVPYAK